MDRFDRLIAGIIIGLLAAIAGVVALGDHVGVPLIAMTPADGSRPPSTTQIRLEFARPMEPSSIETRLRIEPVVDGELRVDGSVVSFTPTAALQPGRVYTVTLESGASSLDGRTNPRAIRWSFTPREPAILYLAPADSPQRSLWRIAPGEGDARQIFAPEFGVYNFAPSPDGTQIAVTVFNQDLTSEIWIIDAQGGNAQALTDCWPGICSTPAWSPDGRLLAYERQDAAATGVPGPSRVWLYDVATGQTGPVFEDNQVLGFTPVWSPDGQWLAFFDANSQAIRVLPLSGGDAILIPSQMGEVGSFSPDSTSMVYTDIRPVGRQYFAELWLALLEGDGAGLRPLLEQAEEDQAAAWSPQGKWIAFGRRRLDRQTGWASQLTLLNPDTGEIRAITEDPIYNNTAFTWSPSGDQILIQRFNLEQPHSTPELWMYDMSSETLQRVTGNGFSGQWIP